MRRDLALGALGLIAPLLALLACETRVALPCAIVGGAVNGWCAGKLWFGRSA
jgi:hypothetical protein